MGPALKLRTLGRKIAEFILEVLIEGAFSWLLG